jgi:hypothetical protein
MIFLSSPTLLQPSNNITNVLLSPTLTWKTQEDAVSYRIQIFSNLSSLILDTVLKSNNFYNQNLFKASVRYLWKVKSINAVGESPWSDLWNFTIMNVPDAPILNFPVNGAKDLLPGIIFKWGTPDLAISYGLQISRNQNFSPIDIDTSGINVASCEIKNLLPNTKYYWRVNASNLVGNGAWSNIWLFNTFITIPAIPILKSPPNTSNIKIDYRQPYVILIWENTNGAETYNLQVSDSISFRNNFIDQKGIKETYFTVNGIKNTQYFWRVKSVNGVGESNWSDIWSMNSQLLGVEPNEYIFPKNFSLLQNYPNPFNPSTRIEYSIPKNDFIELKIFDTYGRLVETLVNKKQQMGTYSLQWKPIDLPSGVYYYQLRTEKYNEVKKMVYIR